MIIFDKVAGSLESIQKQFKGRGQSALDNSETYHEALNNYVSCVRKNIHQLRSYKQSLQSEIKLLSAKVDELFNDYSYRDVENNDVVLRLHSRQKRTLALNYVLHILNTESNSHMYIMTEFDEDLFLGFIRSIYLLNLCN